MWILTLATYILITLGAWLGVLLITLGTWLTVTSVFVQQLPTAVSWLIKTLKHPAVGNLFLLIASVIGVAGSYALYRNKQRNSRQKLKRALAFEVNQMGKLDQAAETLTGLSESPPASRLSASQIPPAEAFPTAVYQSNASDLGLLSEDELESVVDFYTSMLRYKGIIEALRADPDDVPMPDHEEIHDSIPKMAAKRRELLEKLGFENLVEE